MFFLRVILFIVIDIIWVTYASSMFPVIPSDAIFLAFAILLVSHSVTLWAASSSDRAERDKFAINKALKTAVHERQALVNDLFPPDIVKAIMEGSPMLPIVSSGVVVLYCDLVGFTRMCSGMSPLTIMHTMNRIYSVFE